MSTSTIETKKRSIRSPPDFSFPPKYYQSTPSKEAVISNTSPITPGHSSTSPSETTTKLITPVPIDTISTSNPTSKNPTLLTIPLEIRLQIYTHVLHSHRIFHAHLAPPPKSWSSTPSSPSSSEMSEYRTTILSPLNASLPTTSLLTTTAAPAKPQQISALYPISTPTLVNGNPRGNLRGKIPSGLLASCKQIYEESRLLPWELNTFAFINWFWSGVYASRQFTRSLRPWQSDAIRWAGVEVLGRDLSSSPSSGTTSGMVSKWGVIPQEEEDEERRSKTEWEELCTLWKGVWRLKLVVKGSVKGVGKKTIDYIEEGGVWVRPEEIAISESEPSLSGSSKPDKGILDIEQDWVSYGLLQMPRLRWIELEIGDGEVEREEKIRFCADLEGAFNSKDRKREWDGRIRVVFVERKKKDEVPNRDLKLFGGEQGNDEVWSVDM